MPENRAALAAIDLLVYGLTIAPEIAAPNLLYLHGPSGCGKTRLVQALAGELADAGLNVCVMSANNLIDEAPSEADLLIVEDLQHLPTRHVPVLIAWLDERLRQGTPTIVTALHGPSGLVHRDEALPIRLTDRLAGGLVVAIEPMQPSSRRRLLQMLAADAKVSIAGEILDWLAVHLSGGRRLDGAVRQLRMLQRAHRKPLCLADVQSQFHTDVSANDVQRIVERVGGYFQVQPRHLQTGRRARNVVLPRQVSMYLARQLTGLSLQKIGAFFGGRDHKTVQHACAKVQTAMTTDAQLSGIVRRLRAELL